MNNSLLWGCIADDFTGASDAASFLVKGGLKTILFNGLPSLAPEDCQAVHVHAPSCPHYRCPFHDGRACCVPLPRSPVPLHPPPRLRLLRAAPFRSLPRLRWPPLSPFPPRLRLLRAAPFRSLPDSGCPARSRLSRLSRDDADAPLPPPAVPPPNPESPSWSCPGFPLG